MGNYLPVIRNAGAQSIFLLPIVLSSAAGVARFGERTSNSGRYIAAGYGASTATGGRVSGSSRWHEILEEAAHGVKLGCRKHGPGLRWDHVKGTGQIT